MTAPETSRPLGPDSPTAGDTGPALAAAAVSHSPGTTPGRFPTCLTCRRPQPPAAYCECGHLDVAHDLTRDNKTRTACSYAEGPKATPCCCTRFTPKTNEETPAHA